MAFDRCPSCGAPYKSKSSKYCSSCGAERPISDPNHCTNPNCKNHNVDLSPDEQYCDICGSLTMTGEKVEQLI